MQYKYYFFLLTLISVNIIFQDTKISQLQSILQKQASCSLTGNLLSTNVRRSQGKKNNSYK